MDKTLFALKVRRSRKLSKLLISKSMTVIAVWTATDRADWQTPVDRAG